MAGEHAEQSGGHEARPDSIKEIEKGFKPTKPEVRETKDKGEKKVAEAGKILTKVAKSIPFVGGALTAAEFMKTAFAEKHWEYASPTVNKLVEMGIIEPKAIDAWRSGKVLFTHESFDKAIDWGKVNATYGDPKSGQVNTNRIDEDFPGEDEFKYFLRDRNYLPKRRSSRR